MSNQPPSASIDGVQCPSSTPLPPADTRTTLPGSKPRFRMWGCSRDGVVLFTIVFFVILILSAINVPSCVPYRKGSQTNSCIANLKQLEGAREQAILAGKTNPCMADLCGATAYIKVTLVCPASRAVYTVPADPVATFVCPNPGISGDPEWTHSLFK
jgi:hypothetical protein